MGGGRKRLRIAAPKKAHCNNFFLPLVSVCLECTFLECARSPNVITLLGNVLHHFFAQRYSSSIILRSFLSTPATVYYSVIMSVQNGSRRSSRLQKIADELTVIKEEVCQVEELPLPTKSDTQRSRGQVQENVITGSEMVMAEIVGVVKEEQRDETVVTNGLQSAEKLAQRLGNTSSSYPISIIILTFFSFSRPKFVTVPTGGSQ